MMPCPTLLRRLPVVLAALFLLFWAPFASASAREDQARQAWMPGYLKFEDAAKEEKANNALRALELYRDAVTVFKQVQAKYPDWNASLLDYRVRFCQTRIKALEAQIASRNLDLSKSDLTTLARNQDAKIKALGAEIGTVKRQLDTALQARDRAQAEAAKLLTMANQADALLTENKSLRDAQLASDAMVNRLKTDLAKLESAAGLKEKSAELQRRLDLARTRLTELEQADQKYQATIKNIQEKTADLAKEKEKAEAALAEAATQTEAARKEASKRDADVKGLESALANARKETKKLDRELTDAKKLTDTLAQRLQKIETNNTVKAGPTVEEQLVLQQQVASLTRRTEELVGENQQAATAIRALKEANQALTRKNLDAEKALAEKHAVVVPPVATPTVDPEMERRYQASLELVRRLEGQTKALETQLAAAQAKNDTEQLTALQAENKTIKLELANLRSSPAATPAAADALLNQLRQLNRELDGAKEKNQELQAALDQRGAALTATPTAAPANNLTADRERRIREALRQAVAAEQRKLPESAIGGYRGVLELDPKHPLATKRLGLLLNANGEQEEGEAWLRKAFYLNPDDIDVLLPLGYNLVRQGKADLAISMLARAAALHPEDPAIHRAYGVACSSLGWQDAAEAQFRRTLDMAPSDGEAAFNLAVLLVTKKSDNKDEAKELYRKARELGVQADPGLDKLFGLGAK